MPRNLSKRDSLKDSAFYTGAHAYEEMVKNGKAPSCPYEQKYARKAWANGWGMAAQSHAKALLANN